MLKVNDKVPFFEILDIEGKPIKSTDSNQKRIAMFFFRNVACPFCNLKVMEITSKKSRFDQMGLEIYFVFESTKMQIQTSQYSKKVFPISIIADPQKQLYTLFEVENSFLKKLKTFTDLNAFKEASEAAKEMEIKPDMKNQATNIIPASFIFKNETIEMLKYGSDMRDFLTIAEIENKYLRKV